MQRSKEILDELEQLSMVVAGISRQLPFEAPEEGYFSEFPVKMLSQVAPTAPMDVPAGYFEGFAARMLAKVKSLETGSLNADDESSSVLTRIGKTMPYQVPEGYFETSIPSPILMGLKDKTLYEVPDSYFETLSEIIIARVQPAATKQAPAKIVSMTIRKTWWKYAAAAVVAGAIVTVGWLRLQPHRGSQPIVNNEGVIARDLAKVSDQDLQNYVEDHTVQLQQVQQEEDYANSTASSDISETDVKDLLGDIPDGDLKAYMEEHGDLKDYPTN